MDIKSDNVDLKQARIRFGLICDEPVLLEFQARCLEHLLALANVELALFIIRRPAESWLPTKRAKKITINSALFHLYMNSFIRPRALWPRDMTTLLSTVPRVEHEVTSSLGDTAARTIRAYELDFILDLGFGEPPSEMLSVARYGIWSFRYGSDEEYRAGLPCFWEIYYGDDVTIAELQRVDCSVSGRITLKKACIKTIKDSYSRHLDKTFHETARWPARVCIDIRNGNAHYLGSPSCQDTPGTVDLPSNFQLLAFILKFIVNKFDKMFHQFFHHAQWNIGVVYGPIYSLLDPSSKPVIHFLPSKKDSFLADPFGIVKGGKITVLCEEYDWHRGKGSISGAEFTDKGLRLRPAAGMQLPFHMSYPYLVEHAGEIYCIPDTRGTREIRLYKAQPFPKQWIKVSTLLQDVDAIDSTVFQYQGLWWLTCVAAHEFPENCHLCVWYAPDLLGPWTAHSLNPVKIDVRSSRPAGTPFFHGGYLYRPAQDCSRTYGGRVVLNRVMRLTPTEFQEEPAAFVEPDRNSLFPDGLHTLSAAGNITLVDGKRLVFNARAFGRAVSLLCQSIGNKLLFLNKNRGFGMEHDTNRAGT
jgi:hypothetical protein